MMNKRVITGLMLSLSIVSGFAAERVEKNGYGIVPMPYEAKAGVGGAFVLTRETVLVGKGEEAKKCAAYLQERLRKSCGLNLKTATTASGKAIVLSVSDDAVAFSEDDAYRLESSADGITISAKTEQGLFYGVQSLLQLLPPAVYGDSVQAGLELKVPAVSISDKPSMDRIRGLHVDISRHFRTKEEMFKIIDSMAMHKLNTLHIHLTDDDAWRVEIKAYPKLTTVGAIGCRSNSRAPAQFLTQEDAREICAYAKSRYISIIPEVDMPGHMGAVMRSYPELVNPRELRKPGKVLRGDAVGIEFAQKVLSEVNDLFDPEYIHIGCDEVNYKVKAEIYSAKELVDFATALTSFIKTDLKKTPIVWDDAFMHGLHDKDAVVQWWRYGKKYWWRHMEHTVDEEANLRQQPLILSPAYWTYFDMGNVSGGWAGALSPSQVYNWDPYGDMIGVTADTPKLVVGAIACTWSEGIKDMKIFGDRTYPRLASFSERLWRGGRQEAPSILSWPDYRDQVLIPFQLKRYDALGLWYWSKDNPELLQNLPDERKRLIHDTLKLARQKVEASLQKDDTFIKLSSESKRLLALAEAQAIKLSAELAQLKASEESVKKALKADRRNKKLRRESYKATVQFKTAYDKMISHCADYPELKACHLKYSAAEDALIDYLKKHDKQYEVAWKAVEKAEKLSVNIESKGAVSDGETLCTIAIQNAIDECNEAGGGKVVVPAGVWLTGTLVMKDNVELHLAAGATVLGSTQHDDYPTFNPEYRSHKDINGFNALIYAEKAKNIAITGTGTIDGQGKDQLPRKGKQFKSDRDGRPRNILFISCQKIRVEGVTMLNSGCWNQHYLNCEDVIVDRITVYNHANRNNDGIDIDGCRRFLLSNSTFDADDDGICLKSTGPAACEDIVITNCVVSSHCNAIKTGTESTGGFKRVTISDCTVKPSASKEKVFGRKEGITGITVGCVDGGICEDIKISNIKIEGTQAPIFVRLGKRNRPHTDGAKVTKDSTMSDISISHIAATGCGDLGCAFLGLPGNPIKNLQLHDINITFAGGGTEKDSQRVVKEKHRAYPQANFWGKLPVYGLFIRNANAVSLKNLDLQVAKQDQRSPVWLENINGVVLSNLQSAKAVTGQPQVIRKNVTD